MIHATSKNPITIMNIEINIQDYLTEVEIKVICAAYIKERIQCLNKTEFERILGNAAYTQTSEAVDSLFDEDLKALLKQNLRGVITKLSHFTVFKEPSVWDAESNSAYKYLQSCIEQQKPRIKNIVEKQIEPQVIANLKSGVSEAIEEAIQSIYKES